jgi:outer membrane receptor protein involved in Fe transport
MSAASSCLSLSAQNISAVEKPQETQAKVDEVISLEEFVVTGSAIPVKRGDTFQPISIFDQMSFSELGANTPIEGLRSLPGFFGSAGTELRSNGGTGAATVNLRGLGGMLALVDGRRTAGFDEINLVPMIAIDRVEIVKDSAGARYGADALAGAYNSILVSNYRGSKLVARYGNTTEEDAGVISAGLLTGAKAGATDLVVAAEYYHRNALMARDREVSADADGRSRGGRNRRDALVSSRLIGARTGDTGWNILALPAGRSVAVASTDYGIFDNGEYTSSQWYNVRENTASIPEQENQSLYARINHQVLGDGRLEAHARLLYAENTYDSSIWTNGFALSQGVLASSPHRPTGLSLFPVSATTTIGYLHPDSIGPRGRHYDRQVYDFQAGVKGRFGETWAWDLTYVYGWWYRDDFQQNAIHSANLRAAIASGAYNPFALDSAVGVNPTNSLPYDNPAALRSVAATGRIDHDFGVRGAEASITGALANLPGGALEFAGGLDYYRGEQSTVPDNTISATSTYTGFNSTQFSASGYTSHGIYAEIIVPIFGADFSPRWARSLKLSLSGRYSEKEIEGTVRDASGAIGLRKRNFEESTPKLGLMYEPIRTFKVRSTYAEGFRTPALAAQFYAPSTSSAALSDPLGFPIGATVTINSQGNPDLDAENSRTWSTGIAYEPIAVKGLRLEADYYWARLENIVSDSAQIVLDVNAATQGAGFQQGVVSSLNPNATFADRITRDPVSGAVVGVLSGPLNLAFRETSGIDYAVSYRWVANGAQWTSRLAANTTLSWDLGTADGLPSANWLGRFVDIGVNPNSPGSIPRHRGNFTQKWERGSWILLGRANYVSKLEDDRTRTYLGQFRYIESWTTFDTQLGYAWARAKIGFRLGVTNLTDEEAPFAAGAFNDGYDVTTHSNRGRFVYAQVTKTF